LALYYFHLRDGEDILLDPEGVDLSDREAVEKAALVTARALLGAEVREGRVRLDMRLDVEDEAGALVHRLAFADAVEIIPPGD
jgi:hypothetical protein